MRRHSRKTDCPECCGCGTYGEHADAVCEDCHGTGHKDVGRLVREAVSAEREACAAAVETYYTDSYCHPGTNLVVQGLEYYRDAGKALAAAIRARK